MAGRILSWVAKGYGLLLTVAGGGFVGANLAGLVPMVIQFGFSSERALNPLFMLAWMHGGWIVGALVFGGAAVARYLRQRPGDEPSRVSMTGRRARRWSRSQRSSLRVYSNGRPLGIFGSAGVGGLIGGFLGLMLGGSFLLLWFSITYSPLAPTAWISSLSLERQPIRSAGRKEPVVTTDNPVALYAFFGPIALGAATGVLLCGIGTAVEELKSRRGSTAAEQ